jgi:hypothetical protein
MLFMRIGRTVSLLLLRWSGMSTANRSEVVALGLGDGQIA